MFTVYDLVI